MSGFAEKLKAFMKKPQNRLELAVDILCLAASYGLLFLAPDNMNILFWVLFALSAFLFCIGFFRLGFIIDPPKTKKGMLISGSLLVLFGIVLNIAGISKIYASHGSESSISVAVLLLIEAIVMYSITASHAAVPKTQWIMSLIFRAAAVLLVIGAIAYMFIASFSDTAIALGVLLLVEGVVFWAIGGGNNPYNSSLSPIRAVPEMKMTVGELRDALSGTETQLGQPWLGKVRGIREDTIIYGPDEENVFVYGYYHLGRFYLAYSNDTSFLDTEEANEHRTAEVPDGKGTCLCADMLPEAYANMIKQYFENGNIVWSTKLNKSNKKH